MKWDWTIILLICSFLIFCLIGHFWIKETKRQEVCPLAQDKLVTVIVEGNKYTCVYTREPLKTKRKYTKEMWQ